MFRHKLVLAFLMSVLTVTYVPAQNASKPLSNDDVVSMVKAGLPTSTISGAIQSQDTSFDLSAAGLISLKKNGVSQPIMDAMLASASKKKEAAAAQASVPTATAVPQPPAPQSAGASPSQPAVYLSQSGSKQALPLSHTQISQTKTKPSSLGALAGDAALGQAFQGMAVQAASMAALRGGSVMGAGLIGNAGGMMSGLMSHRKPTVTEVWALPGQRAENTAPATAAFEVDFANIPGVNPDEYEPVIVKLTASKNNFRLVGATQAKQDVFDSSTMDWEIYSSFVEERVASKPQKLAAGHYQLQPAAALAPGEYGVALRPLNKNKKFSSSAVAQNSGDGLLFNAVWAFSVQ